MKIRPVGAELFHEAYRQTDGQADMMKLTVTFRNFVTVSKIRIICTRGQSTTPGPWEK